MRLQGLRGSDTLFFAFIQEQLPGRHAMHHQGPPSCDQGFGFQLSSFYLVEPGFGLAVSAKGMQTVIYTKECGVARRRVILHNYYYTCSWLQAWFGLISAFVSSSLLTLVQTPYVCMLLDTPAPPSIGWCPVSSLLVQLKKTKPFNVCCQAAIQHLDSMQKVSSECVLLLVTSVANCCCSLASHDWSPTTVHDND